VSRRDLIFLSLTVLELTFFLLQHYTFYDFIVNKARGKSGPLFNFDVHDDVRLVHDASIEKDEVRFRSSSLLQVVHPLTRSLASPRKSHAGKVVERSWYNRSKHIFPASRWEVYDPSNDYGNYSIKGP
jgi:protein FAM50